MSKLKTNEIEKIAPMSLIDSFKGFIEYQSQLKIILKTILERISCSDDDELLQEITEYYFKMSGKMIRPHFLIQLAKYLFDCKNSSLQGELSYKSSDLFESDLFQNKFIPFAACVEALHNASLLQDDIIDNSATRRNKSTAHNVYGVRKTIFGSNYILSKAADVIADIGIEHLNEIYSNIVFDLTYGEYQQTINKPIKYSSEIDDINKLLDRYVTKTYYKQLL